MKFNSLIKPPMQTKQIILSNIESLTKQINELEFKLTNHRCEISPALPREILSLT